MTRARTWSAASGACVGLLIALPIRAGAQSYETRGSVFTQVGTNTIEYKDGPGNVVAWNLGLSFQPNGSAAGGVLMLGGASGSSSKNGTKTRFEAFAFAPGVQFTTDSDVAASPYFAAGALVATASSVFKPAGGETTRVSASGLGGWLQAGVLVSPDEKLEFGVVGTYSYVTYEFDDRRVNGGGFGITGRIGIRFGGSDEPRADETYVEADPSDEASPTALYDPTGKSLEFWESQRSKASEPAPVVALPSQTGTCKITTTENGTLEAKLQELIALELVDGSTPKGTLDAVSDGIIQLRTGSGTHTHVREAEVKSFTQF